jgi:hypothetical protein
MMMRASPYLYKPKQEKLNTAQLQNFTLTPKLTATQLTASGPEWPMHLCLPRLWSARRRWFGATRWRRATSSPSWPPFPSCAASSPGTPAEWRRWRPPASRTAASPSAASPSAPPTPSSPTRRRAAQHVDPFQKQQTLENQDITFQTSQGLVGSPNQALSTVKRYGSTGFDRCQEEEETYRAQCTMGTSYGQTVSPTLTWTPSSSARNRPLICATSACSGRITYPPSPKHSTINTAETANDQSVAVQVEFESEF